MKLFKNYSYSFDKNEKKILTTFCKQVINQMEGDNRFLRDINNFQSVIDKLNSGEDPIKLTKEEKTKVVLQIKENVKHIDKQMEKSWFIKKWFLKSIYNQYNNLLNEHFKD